MAARAGIGLEIAMLLKGLNHLAFITDDMTKTIRFYRDLLGLRLVAGIGHDGFRHYFFQMDAGQIAFFEYDIAKPMERTKFHGSPTDQPIGFDHVSLTVGTKEDLFHLKDKLEAAGFEVTGAVDHGTMWSIYFFDPNNIPFEASWDCLELLDAPAIEDDDPLAIAAEGAEPQPGVWPEVSQPTAPEAMVARGGNGLAMRDSFLRRGLARAKPELLAALEREEAVGLGPDSSDRSPF
jgi:catechol 2,3-dioxygenase-like lactoylglutathione lyase family enzyme